MVYATVGHSSVCLSHLATALLRQAWAVGLADRRYRSISAWPAVGSMENNGHEITGPETDTPYSRK